MYHFVARTVIMVKESVVLIAKVGDDWIYDFDYGDDNYGIHDD